MASDECIRVPDVQTRYLKRGGTLPLIVRDDSCLWVIYGEGGGCILKVAGAAAGVWIPLRGSLQVHSNGLNRAVRTGNVLITEVDEGIRASGYANGRWLAVLGHNRGWAQLLPTGLTPETPLFPNLHTADHEMRRSAIAVARAHSPLELEGTMSALADKVDSLQASLRRAVARCPGRTSARRHQVFLRLQRVRNYIGVYCNHELSNEKLALMVNLSPCYFLRTFKSVYQETPHAYLINQRLQRAERLLHSSNLAITEVALACGFENRCVFSRVFHKNFGMTAQEARRRGSACAAAG
ncbi:MAG: AraC family transcriptional regulator [Pseudomonadota bacterium]